MSVVGEANWRRQLQCIAAIYSFLWLLAANLVGLWLAASALIQEQKWLLPVEQTVDEAAAL